MFFKKFFKALFYDIAGGLLYGTGIVCFFNSSNIAPGGVSGISIMLNFLFGSPIGITGFLINIPIIIAGYLTLEKSMMTKTLKTVLVTTIIIDCIIPYFPVYNNDRMLASVFGGLLLGSGLALIFSQGSTTGGTDILSYIIRLKYPHFSIGRAMLIVDFVIISVSAVIFKNIESTLYAAIGLFCSAKILDSLLYGADRGTVVFIVSEKSEELSRSLMSAMGRGVTLLKSSGAYTGQNGNVLMCAVRRHEFVRLRHIVNATDGNAFFIAASAEEISGEGFSKNP